MAAQVDLKHHRLYIMDGYSGPSPTAFLVNNSGGYAANATTMVIDTGTGVIQTGDRFQVVGSTAKHTVTAHTETAGDTTSITFTPGLTGAVADNAVITIQPHQVEVRIGEGNLQWTEKKAREYKRDRGLLDEVRDADQDPVEVKFDILWTSLKGVVGSGVPSIVDALKFRGEAASWASSDTAQPCRPKSLRLRFVYFPPCSGEDYSITDFPTFRQEQLDYDAKQGSIACSGKSNEIEAVITTTTTAYIP